MGKIRVVGRARGGRCVYCHDSLGGDVRSCSGCGASWHSDCGAGAPRCPTIGCSGPAPDEQQRAGRRASRATVGEPVWTRPPGLAARFGPYSRLALSGLLSAALVALVLFFFGWVSTHLPDFWNFCLHGKRGQLDPWPLAILKGIVALAFPGAFGFLAARWLCALPGVWVELGELLDSTTPTAMRLGVDSTGSGKKKRWYATLSSGPGAPTHRIRLEGLLPPWWLFRQGGTRVLVYGLPPPGPYIFEFEDGWLALVHPD